MSPTRLLRSLINRLDEIELYYRTTPDDYKITIFLEEAELAYVSSPSLSRRRSNCPRNERRPGR